jgi:hypothetical protein
LRKTWIWNSFTGWSSFPDRTHSFSGGS